MLFRDFDPGSSRARMRREVERNRLDACLAARGVAVVVTLLE